MATRSLVLTLGFLLLLPVWASAWVGFTPPRLRVEGRYLKDPHGNIVKLHGYAQTFSPWFNERGIRWDNFNVAGCLAYNKDIIDRILGAGWKMSFVRMHMDPYWSNMPGCVPDGHELPNCFNEARFRRYLDEVFIPMAEYATSRGMYVIMRPPGVSPQVIGLEDEYNYAQYLMTVWDIVSQHPRIRANEAIMFKLANEPVNIRLPDGSVGNNTQAHFDVLKEIFQPIVNRIRENGFHNVIWIPGSGYQSQYRGFAVNPIEGENIGYAVHIYPGWFGSADGYEVFRRQWDENVGPVAEFAPIVICECDWAPAHYQASWGTGITGVAGGVGFGANFKKIVDDSGNASWLIFTEPHRLAQFTSIPPAPGEPFTFLNDPEACVWPTFHWFQEYAQYYYTRPRFQFRSHSDQGNGHFANPVIHADFPNPDVIRVGREFFMVSATQHYFPGATLLKSYDLVNWEYYSNPLQLIEDSDAFNLLNGLNRYGRGQWSASLRHHNGTFHILFSTPDDGTFLLTATDPRGRWAMRKLSRAFQDPSLLFEGGRIFVAHGIDTLRVTELDANFEAMGPDVDVANRPGQGLRGSRFYRINGQYYILATDTGTPNPLVIFRASQILGPYTHLVIPTGANIGQGALVDTPTGEWWALLSSDMGAHGQLPSLQPARWPMGWLDVGVGGQMITTHRKPNVGRPDYPIAVLPTNDNFRAYRLGMQWGWNHNPDHAKWSLLDRPGFLRLHTSGVVSNLLEARNTLTQRIFGFHSDEIDSYATIKMHLGRMAEGDVAGLAVLQDPYAYIGVTVEGGVRKLVMRNSGVTLAGPTIADTVIYLRAVANLGTGQANFYYSLNNTTYTPFGAPLIMGSSPTIGAGNRFSLFNYATLASGGIVDVDWFSTERQFTEDMFYDPRFVGYSEDQLTLDSLFVEAEQINTLIGTSSQFTINARFRDGRIENIARKATIHNANPEVARVVNGRILSLRNGTTAITAVYEDQLGNSDTIEFSIGVSTFPLLQGLFNPSIWAQGSFNQATRQLITGQWGFGGWWFDNGVNLSDYKYLVVRLQEPTVSGASFRIFDEPNYWSTPYMLEVGSNTQVVVPLQHMFKTVDGRRVRLNPEKLYIVGFWSHGGRPILIDEVFLSNSDEFYVPIPPEPPTSVVEAPLQEISGNDLVDVYTILGIRLRTQVRRMYATQGLPAGMYLVGNPTQGFQRVMGTGHR